MNRKERNYFTLAGRWRRRPILEEISRVTSHACRYVLYMDRIPESQRHAGNRRDGDRQTQKLATYYVLHGVVSLMLLLSNNKYFW
jgi:hypothetical protein